MKSLVNFFIIGAQKSGTSSIFRYLQSHPDIFMCSNKEPNYFVEKSCFAGTIYDYVDSTEEYNQLFNEVKSESIIGEASTFYTKAPRFFGSAALIHHYNPDARLLYIIRDPVERTISHYLHWVRLGIEKRTLSKAIFSEPHYLAVSDYASQLAPYYELFESSQIFVLTFEELVESPNNLLKKVFNWLDVDASYLPENLGERYYENPVRDLFDEARGERISQIYIPFLNSKFLFEKINHKRRLRGLSRAYWMQRDEVVSNLAKILRPKVKELSAMLGRDFFEWKSLF